MKAKDFLVSTKSEWGQAGQSNEAPQIYTDSLAEVSLEEQW